MSPLLFTIQTIDRTTNGSGFVDEFTAEQLTDFDAGAWFDDKFQGEPVPTLEDMLREAKYMRMNVNLALNPKKREDGRLATQVLDVIQSGFSQRPTRAGLQLLYRCVGGVAQSCTTNPPWHGWWTGYHRNGSNTPQIWAPGACILTMSGWMTSLWPPWRNQIWY